MAGTVSAIAASSANRCPTDAPFDYAGGELALFQHARNWKAYFSRHLSPYIAGRVLEVGAGIGSNIERLINPNVREWVALEPDPQLAAEITRRSHAGSVPANCHIVDGTLDAVPLGERFDTILYIDVLEHIDGD